ncbi:hypothetical protein [Planctomyces sp. SH-PL62]|uniref:hypothetical protein n=1 Tax=Planctomyces sp. SH-PL62 TaxID=1636152 RepID=UPI00078E3BA6|nr:hypothetical protein [Planctomyces sp. SH-PL62]AMV40401.1 hypothetical protein VT85_23420 [Planctomyces sp. SH-PL62]
MLGRIISGLLGRLRRRAEDPEAYRIPLDDANHILATFGITRSTSTYERWVKEGEGDGKVDGFDLKDFDSVLFDSPYIITVDWRSPLEAGLGYAADALGLLGVPLRVELEEDADGGDTGRLSCGDGPPVVVSYGPRDDDFDHVVRGVQQVVPSGIEFRSSRWNHGSDTWCYAVLPGDEWADLERRSPKVIEYFFSPPSTGPNA